jgi:hypothetical protein
MARSPARDAEDFARLMLHTVERLSQDGGWVPAGHALEQTLAAHPDHAYVTQIQAEPARRSELAAVAERVRTAEFPHLERRAALGDDAPVCYRIARLDPALTLHLPYEIAPGHPLLLRRHAAEAKPVSARRAALTETPPKSPWRRRLRRRPTSVSADRPPLWSPRLLWARLHRAIAGLAAGITGR